MHLNKERVAGIKAAREANSRESGIPLKQLKDPSRKDIDAFKKRRAERREAAKARDATKKEKPPAAPALPAPPSGAAVDEDDLQEWRATLVELTDDAQLMAIGDDDLNELDVALMAGIDGGGHEQIPLRYSGTRLGHS